MKEDSMRNYLLAAVAAAAIAAPAVAQDAPATGPYVGIEGGVLFPQGTDTDIVLRNGSASVTQTDAFRLNYDTGYDVDAIVGYDLGMFRLEGELGYKRAGLNSIDVDPALIDAYNDATGDTITASDFDADGHATVLSAMVNGLVDFNVGSLGVYAGGGVGYADVKFSNEFDSDNDNGWAYQLIAGLRAAVTPNVDIGLKYRYFQTGNLSYTQDYDPLTADLEGKFRSHSLLASLIYNFGAPAPAAYVPEVAPPPPAPVAPATQTCPDGSVIMATDACPAPPPPPPPPAPPPGERG
jgi:opacity protein-like surface antigen